MIKSYDFTDLSDILHLYRIFLPKMLFILKIAVNLFYKIELKVLFQIILIRADDLAKNCTEVYTYDNGGNILSVTKNPLTWGSIDGVAATNTTNYTYGDSKW